MTTTSAPFFHSFCSPSLWEGWKYKKNELNFLLPPCWVLNGTVTESAFVGSLNIIRGMGEEEKREERRLEISDRCCPIGSTYMLFWCCEFVRTPTLHKIHIFIEKYVNRFCKIKNENEIERKREKDGELMIIISNESWAMYMCCKKASWERRIETFSSMNVLRMEWSWAWIESHSTGWLLLARHKSFSSAFHVISEREGGN